MRWIRGGWLSYAGVLMLVALTPATSWATYPGANGRIAYSAHTYWNDPASIYTVLPDGSGMEKLADAGQIPSWSADGRRLVYASGGQVFTMRADGGNQTQVTRDSGFRGAPGGFSPSGRRIVYVRRPNAEPGGALPGASIFKIRTDGTEERRIVRPDVTSPLWSPNGRWITFDGSPNGARRDGIWEVRPDGSRLRRLTNPSQSNPGESLSDQVLDWSPDGQHILFVRCKVEGRFCDSSNWVMRADGSYKHPIRAWAEVYSPSGDRFAGMTGEIGDPINFDYACTDIYTISLTGSNPQVVTHNCEDYDNGGPGGFAEQPSWQPIPSP